MQGRRIQVYITIIIITASKMTPSTASPHLKSTVTICNNVFPECVARVPVSLGGLGVRLCSPSFAFAFASVRNRPQPSATACGDAVRLSTVASVSGVDQKACQIERLSPQLYWRLQRRCLRE